MIFGKDKKELKYAFNDVNYAIEYLEKKDFKIALFCMLSVKSYLRQMLANNGMSEEDCKGALSKYLDNRIKELVNDHQ